MCLTYYDDDDALRWFIPSLVLNNEPSSSTRNDSFELDESV